MDKKLRITDENWIYGSYHRIHYKKDMLYTFFQYVDIHFVWNVGMGTFSLQDRLVERLQKKGLISGAQVCQYQESALKFLSQMAGYDEWPIEDIYGKVRRIRRDVLGADRLEQDRRQQMAEGCQFALERGIDQTAKKEALLQGKEAVILALCQPEYLDCMKQDMKMALAHECRVYVLVSEEMGACLPGRQALESVLGDEVVYLTMEDESLGLRLDQISYDEFLQSAIDQGHAALLVYGEEGLLHCRDLQIESIIQTIPYGYHARAMVNQLDEGKFNVVYVPKHFDITRWVGMTEKTQLSYWQLWQLWKDHRDAIYEKTVEQLYRSYPQYFLNVYENGSTCPEAEAEYPIQIPREMADDISSYCGLRDQAIGQYMARQSGLTYLSGYFTEEMKEVPVPWDSKKPQTGILVHGIRLASAEKARILHCDPSRTLRQQLGDVSKMQEGMQTSVVDGSHRLQLCSNFLFFLTPKLTELYNRLRKDRPREQLREKQGHLDYQLYWESGRRVESFPLYRKAVLAKKRDGKFILSQYALGGGKLQIAGTGGAKTSISWTVEAVDCVKENPVSITELPLESITETNKEVNAKVNTGIQIYTPYLSRDDDGEGMFANSYRRLVGEGRINLVIIQDKIHCIRRGDVVLPSIGVVVSLSQSYGQDIIEALKLTEQEDGYFDVDGLLLDITLDGPAQIDPEEWRQVEWAYGGGLTLIMDDQSIYGADRREEMQEEEGTESLTKEGWLSPLSRQTQESALHVLVKHPRTAIGIAKNGDLFVLVFSGRTRMSTGADYQEMCHIAKALIPDVESMMNVDGGGSSVLGMAIDGHFMELSYPATSMSSCAGMVRKVNTVLCLEV